MRFLLCTAEAARSKNMLPLVLERWAHIYSSSLLLSLLAFQRLFVTPVLSNNCSGRGLTEDHQKNLNDLARICWFIGFVSWTLWLLTVVVSMSGSELNLSSVQEVLLTQFGHLWLFRSVLSFVIAGGLWHSALRKNRFAWSNLLGIGLAALNVASLAWAGHAGAATGSLAAVHLLTDVSHLLVSAVWPNSLLPLAVWFYVAVKAPGGETFPSIYQVLKRFSAISLGAVAVLATSGLLNSVFMIRRLSDFYTTTYGQILVLKIILFLVMIGLGAQNRRLLRVRREGEPRDSAGDRIKAKRLFQNVCVESTLAFIVFGIVGALGAIPPPAN